MRIRSRRALRHGQAEAQAPVAASRHGPLAQRRLRKRPGASRVAPSRGPNALARSHDERHLHVVKRRHPLRRSRQPRALALARPRFISHPAAARAAVAARARGRAQPLGADQERLGQRVLLGCRALDEHELAQLPLRVLRRQRRDDRGQAPARAVGADALGEALRLPLAEHPGAAGADGRGERGARLRPGAPALRAARRVRGRTRAGDHADRRGDLASQQPRRAADAVLRRGGVVHRAGARDRADEVARVGRRDRGPRASRRRWPWR